MADYYSVLSRAIESLRPNTAETRRVLYERAEQTLLAQLRALDPPASQEQIEAQTKSLTDAIARIEAEHAVSEALSMPELDIAAPEQTAQEPEAAAVEKTDTQPEPEAPKAEAPKADVPMADVPKADAGADAAADVAVTPSATSGEPNDTMAETLPKTPAETPAETSPETPAETPPEPPKTSTLPDPARLEVKRTPTFGSPLSTSGADVSATDTSDTGASEQGASQPDKTPAAPLLSGAQQADSPFRRPPRLSAEPRGLSASAADRAARSGGDRVEPSLGAATTSTLTSDARDVAARDVGARAPLAGDAPRPRIGDPRIAEPRTTEPPKAEPPTAEPQVGGPRVDQPGTDGATLDEPKPDEPRPAMAETGGVKDAGVEGGESSVGGFTDEATPSDPFLDEAGGRRRGGGWMLLLVLLIVVGIIGGGVYWFRGPILEWSEAILEMISAPATEEASDKIEDRLTEDGAETATEDEPAATDTAEGTTDTDTDAVPAAPDVLESGVAEAQLIEQNADDPNSPDRTPGTVRWQTEGSGDQLELVGSVDVPGRGVAMSMRFAKNTDETFPATHTVIFQFSLSPDFEHGGVQDVPRLLLKQTAQSSGNALVTDVIPLDNNAFLMALSGVDLDAERNLTELKTRPFLDVPLIYADGRLAILTIAKGAQGDRAFADAFTAWGQ